MERCQVLFFDGIRISIEMADLAYKRLSQTLERITGEPPEAAPHAIVPAMDDAWSILDCVHRLVGLVQQVPGLKDRDRSPSIRTLFGSSEITALRNIYRHLNHDIKKRSQSNLPILRVLTWTKFNGDRTTGSIGVLGAGTIVGSALPL
jgi:hypothetical protein